MEQIHHVIVDGVVSSNQLIAWNNSFGVDGPFMEKPFGWFAQADITNCTWVKF